MFVCKILFLLVSCHLSLVTVCVTCHQARHEDRVPDKMLKARFSKEFDLPERIATLSLRGGLLEDGRLFVSALARVSTLGLSRDQLSELASQEVTARQATPCSVVDLSTFPPVACQACR